MLERLFWIVRYFSWYLFPIICLIVAFVLASIAPHWLFVLIGFPCGIGVMFFAIINTCCGNPFSDDFDM